MSDEPRYTREEWEEIQRQEALADAERAKEQGHLCCTVFVSRADINRLTNPELKALVRTKLAQARAYIHEELGL